MYQRHHRHHTICCVGTRIVFATHKHTERVLLPLLFLLLPLLRANYKQVRIYIVNYTTCNAAAAAFNGIITRHITNRCKHVRCCCCIFTGVCFWQILERINLGARHSCPGAGRDHRFQEQQQQNQERRSSSGGGVGGAEIN